MRNIKQAYSVAFPEIDEIPDNFTFSAVHPDGVFKFTFRYFNGRWNCFVTLPDGSVRAAGVEPVVPSWTGFLDYGIIFITDLPVIARDSLFLTKPVIITWE